MTLCHALIPRYIAYNVHYTGYLDNEPFCDCVGGEVLRRLCLILGRYHTVCPYKGGTPNSGRFLIPDKRSFMLDFSETHWCILANLIPQVDLS